MDEEKKLASIELPDYTIEKPMNLEVDVVYQGSFRLAKNGMIIVKPYQSGTKPGNLKKALDGDRHAIYLSKNLVRVVISLHKGSLDDVMKDFKEVIIECYKDLSELAL